MSDVTNSENDQQPNDKMPSMASSSSTWSSTGTPIATPADVEVTFEEAGAAPKPEETNPKRKYMIPVIIVLAVLIVAAIIVAAVALNGSGFYDDAAKEGQAPYKTEEEMRAEMDRSVEDGMLNISIASMIEFQDGTSSGTAYIENVPSNKYDMKVTITLDSNGDVVYQSKALKPNSYIETIKLDKDLDAGTYPATATFTAYEPDSQEEVGQAAAKITLVVNQ